MPGQILRNLVYFPNGPSGIESDLAALAANPYYSNVVLGQFHFNEPDGHITWNETTLSEVSRDVWTAVGKLAQGEYPKIVSMQMGAAGKGMTWGWIAKNPDAAAESLIEIVRGKYPIVGIDLDPEPIGTVPLKTIYDFTLKLGSYKVNTPFYLSHVPVPFDGRYFPELYSNQYWPQMAPFIDWITPQWYGLTYEELVSKYKGFVDLLSKTPLPVAQEIVVAGQESASTSLLDLKAAIMILGKTYSSNWGGVGVWAYPLPTSPDWAKAIYDALHGSAAQ